VHTDLVSELALDVKAAWTDLLAAAAGKTFDQLKTLVAVTFQQRDILPTQVRDRLTAPPVATR
jgi:hypothetical protein